ncbi:MAG: PfkB family carbohydrate kinase [Bacillota bacterium]
MKNREIFIKSNPRPICIGTGLVALDVVINGDSEKSPKLSTGGSCGNVLIALSYLGWNSYPIARLGDDAAAVEILKDLKSWNVNTSLILQNNSSSTPIIIEKIGTNRNGAPWHRFEWVCPNCGSYLPKYKPVLVKDVEFICNNMPFSQVFYFDRVSRSSIELAKINKSRGAIIVFEPSGIQDEKLFIECIQVSDVVKYSNERLSHIQELTQEANITLEIETMGSEGLRYRLANIKTWKVLTPYSVENLKDSAGAGDWCTAGIIHLIGRNGRKGFEGTCEEEIVNSLRLGQALGAFTCCYEGARGSMYSISKEEFQSKIYNIMNGTVSASIEDTESNVTKQALKCVCPFCTKKEQNK